MRYRKHSPPNVTLNDRKKLMNKAIEKGAVYHKEKPARHDPPSDGYGYDDVGQIIEMLTRNIPDYIVQNGIVQLGVFHDCPSQIHAFQIGAREVRIRQICARQNGAS